MIDLHSIPHDPGCYIFKDKARQVLYVGKAKDLRKRVSSYFQKKIQDKKTEVLLSKAEDVEFFVTNTETEALILENNLIKKHAPKYNIDLKDSKRYAYIHLTDESFPRLVIARKADGGGEYFGPFTSGESRDYILSTVTKTFRLRTCRRMPKKACLRHHLGLCRAPCEGLITAEDYKESIRKAAMVLKGHAGALQKELKERMAGFSKEQNFEAAKDLRDQVYALDRLLYRQTMERKKDYDEDIIDAIVREGMAYVLLFNVYKGTLENKEEFVFEPEEDFFETFLQRYYDEHPVPKEIIVPYDLSQALVDYLTQKRGGKIIVTVPKMGEKRRLLDLVKRNIEISFFGDQEKLEALQKTLRLHDVPRVIECFDISHLHGEHMVGSMVQFRNGRPDKSGYRRFRIRTVSGIDDFRAIAEVVRRRYSRLKAEDAEMPGLIVIDGGKGQLSFALEELGKLGLKVPVIALAKRLEEIHVPGLPFPLRLAEKDRGLNFLRQVRDEAHRFAIAYNRLLRKKEIR